MHGSVKTDMAGDAGLRMAARSDDMGYEKRWSCLTAGPRFPSVDLRVSDHALDAMEQHAPSLSTGARVNLMGSFLVHHRSTASEPSPDAMFRLRHTYAPTSNRNAKVRRGRRRQAATNNHLFSLHETHVASAREGVVSPQQGFCDSRESRYHPCQPLSQRLSHLNISSSLLTTLLGETSFSSAFTPLLQQRPLIPCSRSVMSEHVMLMRKNLCVVFHTSSFSTQHWLAMAVVFVIGRGSGSEGRLCEYRLGYGVALVQVSGRVQVCE
ncbi:hypothetical protein P153DRAFT_145545 [Dothidotthia symphoricarpi CBS 119687]|uniref:Uncharacterized protein n=1 Tax=Dothidotthia symphoricarpi CBS 119687 TaxID=1392245 RepID=A0A6A5ZXX0_9PLEO|nr:uncharacterized protein P153DRAFT_145545 [Dothidotthia symphoricarpi CBS 119687]KAF2123753.1 hypothetical protein P153DRAFT_145545 [Dothidotthia symphoricarpi CBS 119687]